MKAGALTLAMVAVVPALAGTPARAADAAAAPAALVMELSGRTEPPLTLHREVAPGTRVKVTDGSSVALLHYASCTIYTVKGGSATIAADRIEAPPPATLETRGGPCPRVYKIASAGPGAQGGAVVTRTISLSGMQGTALAADGLVVLSGPGATKAAFADVVDLNQKAIETRIPITNGSFQLKGSMRPKQDYTIKLSFSDGRAPVDVPVSVPATNTAGLLIIQFD